MSKLDVYISEACWACEEARRIAVDISPLYPTVAVELRDIGDARRPERVFATPTYVLDGRIIFLGNPTLEQLAAKLAVAQDASK